MVGLSALGMARATIAGPACPPRLEVVQAPTHVPVGFRAARNAEAPTGDLTKPIWRGLATIAFSDGPPTDLAWLAPDRSTARSQHWAFTPGADAGVWYSCGYLATDVIVSAPLPGATRACLVSLDSATSPPTPTRFVCR